MDKPKAIQVRFPDEMYKIIKKAAESERRSFNSQVLIFLDLGVKK